MENFQDLTAEEARIVDEAVRIIQSRLLEAGDRNGPSIMLSFRKTWGSKTYFDRDGGQHPNYTAQPLSAFINGCMTIERAIPYYTDEERKAIEVERLKARLAELEA